MSTLLDLRVYVLYLCNSLNKLWFVPKNCPTPAKRKKNDQLKLANVEKAILEYNNWIKMTNREDKIESYEIFLQG